MKENTNYQQNVNLGTNEETTRTFNREKNMDFGENQSRVASRYSNNNNNTNNYKNNFSNNNNYNNYSSGNNFNRGTSEEYQGDNYRKPLENNGSFN